MEFVRTGGGWRGTEMEVALNDDGFDDDDGGDESYVRARRNRAESQLERLIDRWSAVGNTALEDDSEDDEDEVLVAADVPWRERSD